MNTERFTRRSSLARLAGALVTAAGGRALLTPGRGWQQGGRVRRGESVLTPELTDPYYIRARRFAATSARGTPARPEARLRVLDASTCKPIKGASVDIWHCDAAGVYSGFGAGAASRTFLRGTQMTDANGLAMFTTIYPGWYQGRAVHIHVKVHVGGKVVHTGQLFFPDAFTDAVYSAAPYSDAAGPDMPNAQDSIFVNGGSRGCSPDEERRRLRGSITMGVHK